MKSYLISPYVYCVNKLLLYSDPQGEPIRTSVYDEDTKAMLDLDVQDGKKGLGFYDKKGTLYWGSNAFVGSLTSALNTLYEGKAGKELLTGLMERDKTVRIRESEVNGARTERNIVEWNSNSTDGGMDVIGSDKRPAYIGLGHELAHVQDAWRGSINKSMWKYWIGMKNKRDLKLNIVTQSEKYATHIENMLRSEHHLSLRSHYGKEIVNGKYVGWESTRLIDQDGRSLFFQGNNGMPYKY